MPKHYPLNRPLLSNAKMFGHRTVARYQVYHTALQHTVNKKYVCIYLHSEYNLTFNWCLVPALHPVQDIIDKVGVFTSLYLTLGLLTSSPVNTSTFNFPRKRCDLLTRSAPRSAKM